MVVTSDKNAIQEALSTASGLLLLEGWERVYRQQLEKLVAAAPEADRAELREELEVLLPREAASRAEAGVRFAAAPASDGINLGAVSPVRIADAALGGFRQIENPRYWLGYRFGQYQG